MSTRDISQLDWESVKGVLIEEFLKRQDRKKEKVAEDALIAQQQQQYENARYTNERPPFSLPPTRGGSRGGGRGGNRGARGSGRNYLNQHPYNNRPNRGGGRRVAFSGPCFICNKMGHVARACPENEQNEQGNIAEHSNSNIFHENDFALINLAVDSEEIHPQQQQHDLSEEENEDVVIDDDIVENEVENIVVVDTNKETDVDVDKSDFAFVNLTAENDSSSKVAVDHEWYIDSAATKHMSNKRSVLQNFIKYEAPTQVFLGDESNILAFGEGQLRLPTANGTCLALKQVLWVPKLSKNLLSVPTMTKSGSQVIFDKDKCCVVNKEGRSLTIGHCINEKLYKVTSPSESAYISAAVAPSPSLVLLQVLLACQFSITIKTAEMQ